MWWIQCRIFSPGAVDCDSSIRLERLILDFLTAPAAGWLHCISSHTKNHHGAHPETVNTEELSWMGSFSLWDYLLEGRGRALDLCRAWDRTDKMPSGLGCFRCGRYLEVWWQKSSESLASPPLLCWMSWGVRCHWFVVLQIFRGFIVIQGYYSDLSFMEFTPPWTDPGLE